MTSPMPRASLRRRACPSSSRRAPRELRLQPPSRSSSCERCMLPRGLSLVTEVHRQSGVLLQRLSRRSLLEADRAGRGGSCNVTRAQKHLLACEHGDVRRRRLRFTRVLGEASRWHWTRVLGRRAGSSGLGVGEVVGRSQTERNECAVGEGARFFLGGVVPSVCGGALGSRSRSRPARRGKPRSILFLTGARCKRAGQHRCTCA